MAGDEIRVSHHGSHHADTDRQRSVAALIAVFLILVVNTKALMESSRNAWIANGVGALVVLVVVGLGLYQFARVCGLI